MNRMALIACFVAGSASAQITGFTSTPINFAGNASSQAVDPSGNIWITDPTIEGLAVEIDNGTHDSSSVELRRADF
jgi:hypothetical protein